MGPLVLLALALLAAAVPDAAPHLWAIDRHAPDLFLALAAYLALRGRGYEAVPWAIGLGALKDCASLDPLGTHAFVLGTVAFLLSSGRERSGKVRGVTRALAVAGAGALAHAIYLVRSIPVTNELPTASALLAGLPIGLWTAVFAAPLLALLDRTGALDDLAGRRRGVSP